MNLFKKYFFIVLLSISGGKTFSQLDSIYDRREEIIDDGKRYRIHNNYLGFGAGLVGANIRDQEQAIIGIDYVFHIRNQHFQVGILMSGDKFLSNNNAGGHIGYGYRSENEKRNIAFFVGPCYHTGVLPPVIRATDTVPARIYDALGIYASAAYYKKITYDIGIGAELVVAVDNEQMFAGVKAVMFFSGAYRGKAKIYNKYVRPKKR